MRKGADYASICRQFNISLPLARLMRNRGICGQTAIENYLYGSLSMLADPSELPDIAEAVGLLAEAIEAGAPLRVIGDYDVDGVCASYCLTDALRALGAQVDADVPDRKGDGYGVNSRMLEQAAQDGIEVVITCDNGISAFEAVETAAQLGLSVIVTDHHEPGDKLPAADAVIDPKRADSTYPQRDICGAVVAWQTMRALYAFLKKDMQVLDDLLPFMALATVCDVVPLTGDSRIIVKEGLKRMRTTQHIGMKALIQASALEQEKLSAYHLGFVLGPCINACGRLTSARDALSLFRESDPVRAQKKAMMIRALNDQRKSLTEAGLESARIEMDKARAAGDSVYVLYARDCDESVAGIVAGRIREEDYRPTILLTRANDGRIKGSGRSVPGYDLFAALNAHAEMFEKFGGHEQAAGLTMTEEHVDELRRILNSEEAPDEQVLTEKLYLDMVLPFSMCSEELAGEIAQLDPCGVDNRRALFAARHVRIDSVRLLGKDQNVLSMTGDDGTGVRLPCIYFGDTEGLIDKIEKESGVRITECTQQELASLKLTLAYVLNVNEYRDRRTVQAVIRDVLVES